MDTTSIHYTLNKKTIGECAAHAAPYLFAQAPRAPFFPKN
jgi:hypothetical protein